MLAQVFRAIAVTGLATHDTAESCARSYPGFCIHNVSAGGCCPGGYALLGFCPAAGSFDVVCEMLTHWMGLTLESWTIHWLLHWNGWTLILLGPMQVKMASETVAAHESAVSVPLYSTAILFFTILCGVLYFDDAASMRSLPTFAAGVVVVGAGLLVLSRAKEQRADAPGRGGSERGGNADGRALRAVDEQASGYDMRPLPEVEAMSGAVDRVGERRA